MARPIKRSEHVFIAGGTGSGKTFLASHYLSKYKNVIVLDTKGMFDNWDYMCDNELTVIEKLADIEKVKTSKIIYRPIFQELTEEYYNLFFSWVYRRKNTIVLIDEAMQISPNPHILPEWLRGCLQRGRQKNISIWALTQRPKSISPLFLSESTHIFTFRLNLEQDRRKVVDVTGHEEFYNKPEKHCFWYLNLVADDGKVVKGKLEIGGKK